MARLFTEHIKREITCLDGVWKYAVDKEDNGESKGYEKELMSPENIIIPSVWNNQKDLLQYEGVVFYEKDFYTAGGTLRFSFGAVMTEAKVFLDGELIGEHCGGFCKFSFTKRGVLKGFHRLTVKVDNRFDDNSIPKALVDWYHYGGITRSVTVERLSGICVLYSLLDYEIEGSEAICKLRLELFNADDCETVDTVSASVDGIAVSQKEVILGGGEYKNEILEFTLKDIERWSIESPRLYDLLCESSSDDLYDRIGFRNIKVEDKKILLNGEPILLKGVNRHEEYPDFGMAFPPALMKRDLEIIEDMGANTIRGSHYPNDPLFVDMLDEEGVIFWSEVPMWGPDYGERNFSDSLFFERAMAMHREMVKEYYNHPSICIWGIFNETDTSAAATENFAHTCYDFLKAEGGNRLITFATNQTTKDICLKWCDFISLNLYIGWYDYPDEGFENWESTVATMNKYFEEVGVSNKPLVMSEFGAAAIYGNHTFDNLKWTEEYQAELIRDCLELFYREGFLGTYIWQFSDIRTAKEMGLNRARSFNNKGLVNEYRKPKLAYRAVSDFYKKLN